MDILPPWLLGGGPGRRPAPPSRPRRGGEGAGAEPEASLTPRRGPFLARRQYTAGGGA